MGRRKSLAIVLDTDCCDECGYDIICYNPEDHDFQRKWTHGPEFWKDWKANKLEWHKPVPN
jgi:hypothetical protein